MMYYIPVRKTDTECNAENTECNGSGHTVAAVMGWNVMTERLIRFYDFTYMVDIWNLNLIRIMRCPLVIFLMSVV